jgi:hypothetical protein
MILLVLINGALQIFSDDRIPIHDGLGFDGVLYGRLAIDFESTLRAGLTFERVQRSLPSALIHVFLTATGITRTPRNVIMTYELWNLGLLVASVVCWDRIAETLGLGPSGRWLGFLGLFVNFCSAKLPYYHPLNTDQPAFLLGLLMCLAYFKGSLAGLVAVLAAGSFTWSSFGPFCLLLMAVPRRARLEGRSGVAGDVVALAAALLFAAARYAWLSFNEAPGAFPKPMDVQRLQSVFRDFTPFLLLLLRAFRPILLFVVSLTGAAYLFLGLRPLLEVAPARFVSAVRPALSVRGLAMGLSALAAVKVAAGLLSSIPSKWLGWMMIRNVVWGHAWPLWFLVASVVWFGPIILLMAFYWRTIARAVLNHGPGAMLFIAAAICVSPIPEARHLTAAYPLLVAMTAEALDRVRFSRTFYILFAAASVAFSKAWLRIGHEPFEGDFWAVYEGFPAQWYFMSTFNMSRSMYLAQGAAGAATATALWWLLPRAPRGELPGNRAVADPMPV